MRAELRKARVLMIERNFAGEFARLLKLASELARQQRVDIDDETLRGALRELLIAFPVYRTYGTAQGFSTADRELLRRVTAQRAPVNLPRTLRRLVFSLGCWSVPMTPA